MPTPIRLPELGTGTVRLSVWYANVGDQVRERERLIEVLVDGATFDVVSPGNGRLSQQRFVEGDSVVSGQILGIIDTEEE